MKLWEALEKSNKVRRKSWTAKYHYKIENDKAFSLCNDDTYKMFEVFPCNDFLADDWEPYEEPKAEEKTGIDKVKEMIKANHENNGSGRVLYSALEILKATLYVLEDQQQKIDQLESEQQKWKHMSIAKVDSGIPTSGTGGSGYGKGGSGGIYKSLEQMRCEGEVGAI